MIVGNNTPVPYYLLKWYNPSKNTKGRVDQRFESEEHAFVYLFVHIPDDLENLGENVYDCYFKIKKRYRFINR